MEQLIFKLFSDVVIGYILSSLAVVMLAIFYRRLRPFKIQYLDSANLTVFFFSLAFFFLYCIFFSVNAFAVQEGPSRHSYRSGSIIWTAITTLFIPSLFLYKKLRQHFLITLLVMISLLLFTFYEKAIIIITNFYRDYLPSSWSADYGATPYLSVALASLFYFAVVMIVLPLRKENTQIVSA